MGSKSVILYLPANTFETGSLDRITLSDHFEGAVYALPFFLFNTTLHWDRLCHPKYSHKAIGHNPDPVVRSAQVRCIEVSSKSSLKTFWCCNFDERMSLTK